ncbi:glucosamine-6-phosphate deaminase [Jeotgalibacillus haloalkalitolerans]|uniref:Glucosamine-6-phosphate deaminase n=1 Tax=Jeotgalibacillus haloalkalitolerans TaxID=3104292 RepID=A0ABU5KIC6_9BACL|nr:glucosamine-6-phosphate deaminase [Jeotgalibacillus sp. HH7-29]MDZ5710990.1 glucosamine-6-phosphate deaminase [Jeotgalibacillus sp. HH7-29]
MDIVIVKNYIEMSKVAAGLVRDCIREQEEPVLGLATGGTPIGLYQLLVRQYRAGLLSFKHMRTFNLDEYIGLDPAHSKSYHRYMQEHLFSHIDIPRDQTFLPDGMASNLEKECRHYEKLLKKFGPPDLQILGIGENGHIGFNEPGSDFNGHTHVISLADSTREANARYFQSLEEVPTHAITMGIKSILHSKKIVLLASGERKAAAVRRLLEGTPDPTFPASALSQHNDVVLIADEKAFGN